MVLSLKVPALLDETTKKCTEGKEAVEEGGRDSGGMGRVVGQGQPP